MTRVTSLDKIYFVYGGQSEDFTFKTMKDENYVEFGPFYCYEDAFDSWKNNSWLNVDNALYRLLIDEYDTNGCKE